MYLAPHKISGKNFCPHASAGCIAACLFTAGRGRYRKIAQSRINRSHFFINDRAGFMAQLNKEIGAFVRKCDRQGKLPAVRLNGTSDLAWERLAPSLFRTYDKVQFYDYTKSYNRMLTFLDGRMPSNYHLTFSLSEVNEAKCLDVLERGGNIAGVFRESPDSWHGYPTHDADKHDLRFLDPFGVGVLKMKGRAKHDRTGFVQSVLGVGNPGGILLRTT
jgi:hypothetical protein